MLESSETSTPIKPSLPPTTVTLDVETSGLDWRTCKLYLNGYTLNRSKEVTYVETDKADPVLYALLADESTVLSGHNVKFDALVLSMHGYRVLCRLEDTRIMAYLNWPTLDSHGLKSLVRTKLGRYVQDLDDLMFTPLKKEVAHLTDYERHYWQVDEYWVRRDLLKEYHKEDVLNVDRLRARLVVTDWFRDVEMPLTRMLFEMELYGCPLDKQTLVDLKRNYSATAEGLLERLRESVRLVGFIPPDKEAFNPNSHDQVREVLRLRKYKLEDICEKTKSGDWSVDKPLLKSLMWKGDEFCKILLEYRRYSKILSTYVGPFLKGVEDDGKLHGSINQAGSEDLYGDGAKGTNTGRLSSSNPNLQNIPSRTKEGKEVRKAFIASDRLHMFDSDLSQIEPRLVAHYSQAPKLIHAYANDLDTHGLFANDIFGKECGKDSVERFIGKSSWLATVYGCSYKKLLYICEGFSDNPLTMDTEAYADCFYRLKEKEQAKVIRDCGKDYKKIYEQWMFFKNVQDVFTAKNPEIFNWRQNHIDRTRRLGYVITIGGRKIAIENLDSRDWGKRFAAERQAVNYQIQGSAADVMKLIMVRFDKEFVKAGLGHVFSTVHDEVLGDLWNKESIKVVKDIMENTVFLRNVKIKSDTKLVGSWGDK